MMNKSQLIDAIFALPLPEEVRIMEVCGTHTMAIAKSGIKSLLPDNVTLLSGPGCPVCVTPPTVIDTVLELSMQSNVVVTTYGDMVRVPGSRPGDNLARRRALGAKVEVVYSPVDAVDLAETMPDREVVFLGAGFETTAPGTAAAVLTARERKVENFSVFSMLKMVEPALRTLIASDGFNVQGFLCPGHVGTIIGEEGFRYLPEEYRIPAVIAGFEPEELLDAIYCLLRQISESRPALENRYTRAVAPKGNVLAQKMMAQCFTPAADEWRGLGRIEASGLKLCRELEAYDAEKKFPECAERAQAKGGPAVTACRCGDVITGKISPADCPLFARRCVPEDPVGPCMVSSEGACAAAYKYGDFE